MVCKPVIKPITPAMSWNLKPLRTLFDTYTLPLEVLAFAGMTGVFWNGT